MADNHPTEAACLLEQGASYHRHIGLEERASQGDPIFAGFKTGAVFPLFWRRTDLPFRSRGALAAGVCQWHTLLEGTRRERSGNRSRAQRRESDLEAAEPVIRRNL